MSIFSDFANSINDVVDAQNNRVQKTQKERNDPKVQQQAKIDEAVGKEAVRHTKRNVGATITGTQQQEDARHNNELEKIKKENTVKTSATSVPEPKQNTTQNTDTTKYASSEINPNKIAVILPDESFAATLELFDRENYFNFAMGKTILNKNIYQKSNAIYNYILENELKNIENIKFLNLDFEFIEKEIKPFWNKVCTKERFIQITDFLKNLEQNLEILEKYDEIVYKLNFVLFSQNFNLKLKDIYKIFLQKLAKISLDDAHSGKITVIGLLETRLIDFDAIIICDFNNSFIPKISLKDKFLSTKVKYLATLPTKIDRENLQKYYYKRLIDSSKNIFISYVESKEDDISKFAYELFSDIKISTNDDEYKDILYKSRKLEYKDEEIFLNIDLTKQTWSASGLKMFLECKRKWYLNYILKLKEHTISKLPKSFELGNIVHSILEESYKNKNSNIDEIFLKD